MKNKKCKSWINQNKTREKDKTREKGKGMVSKIWGGRPLFYLRDQGESHQKVPFVKNNALKIFIS